MSEAKEWVVRKGGYFYRPGAHGYTANFDEAARYTEVEAKSHVDLAAGVTARPASDFEPKPDKVMTAEEYLAANIKGWHAVCWNVDGFGNVGVRYHGNGCVNPSSH